MDLVHGHERYTSEQTQDHEEGWSAIELHRVAAGGNVLVARVVFWDAEGQFFLEMPSSELPLRIVESLISEAKHVIRTG